MFAEPNDELESFHDCIQVLYWQGFWRDEAQPDLEFYLKYFNPRLAHLLVKHRSLRMALRLFQRFNPWFLIISLAVQVFYIFPTGIYMYKNDASAVVGNFLGIIIFGIHLTSYSLIFFQQGSLQSLLQIGEMLGPRQLDNKKQKEIYSNTRRYCNKVIKCCQIYFVRFMWIVVTLDTCFHLLPQRRFPFKEWYPWDATLSPVFEITLFIRWIQTVFDILMGATTLSMSLGIMILPRSNFEILNDKLQNIRHISIHKIRARKLNDIVRVPEDTVVIIEFEHSQQVDMALRGDLLGAAPSALSAGCVGDTAVVSPLYEAGVFGSSSAIDEMHSEDLIESCEAGVFGSSSAIDEMHSEDLIEGCELKGVTDIELHTEMQDILAENIQLHVKLIRYLYLLGQFTNIALMVAFLANILVLGVAFKLYTEADENSRGLILILMFVCIQMPMFYFVMNNVLQHITVQHETVCESMYNSDWLDASPSFKKSMLVIMSRSNVPLEVKPTGLDPLSRRNFAQVMYDAYKMMNTLFTIIK